MSGGGGGGIDWTPDEKVDCAKLFEKTILNSPVPDVVSGLQPRDVLTVELRSQSGRKSLIATDAQGRIAGSLTPVSLPKIINCIETGFEFVAVVIEVRGGRCFVEIRPKAA